MRLEAIVRLSVAALMLGTSSTQVLGQGVAGPYLAATSANMANDYPIAAEYYVQAMSVDTENLYLKQNALFAFVASGQFEVSTNVARAILPVDSTNIYASLVIMTDHISKEAYEAAVPFLPADDKQLSPLLWGLVDAWLKVGSGDLQGAVARFEEMSQEPVIESFAQYHLAMALAYNGSFEDAVAILDGDEKGPLFVNTNSIIAHVQLLCELDREQDALDILEVAAKEGFRDKRLALLKEDIEAGNLPSFTLMPSVSYGVAEAFVTIAEALSREEPSRLALFYSRLAEEMRPGYVDAHLISADLLLRQDQYVLAGEAYDAITEDSVAYASARIGRAEAFRADGELDLAIDVLETLVEKYPDNLNALNALGDVYRSNEQFTEAVDAYTRAIDTITETSPGHWVLYYSRAISYDQIDQWEQAEADLRRALQLTPEQPYVLNYLGYSYIDKNINLNEAQEMIEVAVGILPNSGFITDSLAWGLYRLGKYEEALPHMQRAAELLPVDPIVNDHFGDVLWMVGRKMEARFQWRRALSFEPEEKDAIRIRRKLEVGLDVVLDEEA